MNKNEINNRVKEFINKGHINTSLLDFKSGHYYNKHSFAVNRLLVIILMYNDEIINYDKYKAMLRRLYIEYTDCNRFSELKYVDREGELYHCKITKSYYSKDETYDELNDKYYHLSTDDVLEVRHLYNALKIISNRSDKCVKHLTLSLIRDILNTEYKYSNTNKYLREILEDLTIDRKEINMIRKFEDIKDFGYCQCEYCGSYNESLRVQYERNESIELLELFEDYFKIY